MLHQLVARAFQYNAKLSDTKIHGTYHGINPIAASRGLNLDVCRVSFTLSADGFNMITPDTESDETIKLTTHYPASWVFHLQGWGIDHHLGIRQSETSDLAQLTFDFSSFSVWKDMEDVTPLKALWSMIRPPKKNVRVKAMMYLGEGMPAPLGMFVREDTVDDVDEALSFIYNLNFIEPENKSKTSWLLDIDMRSAHLTMQGNDENAQIEILEKIEHNLWTGEESEIKERLELVALGLNAQSTKTHSAALKIFTLGGRVVQGVPLVTKYAHANTGNTLVENDMSDALSCLLYEAWEYTSRAASLQVDFGTTNVTEIKRRGTIFTPNQLETLQWLGHKKPQNSWTVEHQRLLRTALEDVLTHSKSSPIKERCKESLRKYPLPT